MAEILGKDLDNWDDSLAAREPYSLPEVEPTGAQFMTGTDLMRSATIDSSWKEPVAVYAQAYSPIFKGSQPVLSAGRSLVDVFANLPSNIESMGAQIALEDIEEPRKKSWIESVYEGTEIGQLKNIFKKTVRSLYDIRANQEILKSQDEVVNLLNDRNYPLKKYAQRVIANATADVENRRIVRELYNQSQGIDSSAWYNQAGSIIGAMLPAMAVGNLAWSTTRTLGAGRAAATKIAENVAKGFIGAEMAGEYAEETAAQYLQRTGDKNFENFTAKDASGLSALAYGAIGAQIEFMGGVEPIMAGALSKVGLRSGLLKAGAKIAGGEATEELLQGLTETLFRKIEGSTDKTWKEGIEESLKGALWGAVIGGFTGAPAFYVNRRNLVKGIKNVLPTISNQQATMVADAMIDSAGEISTQDPTLRGNLRDKISMMYKDIDMDEKEARIDAITDLEYGLIAMDSAERGIEIAENPLFSGEVTPFGWFREGIPEARRAEIQGYITELTDLQEQLKKLNEAQEKDWNKIDEIETKLNKFNTYVLEKLSDLARADSRQVAKILRDTEQKFVQREKERATKKAIKFGNVDMIADELSKAGFKTRDMSGTQIKELARLNWELLQDIDLGKAQSRGAIQKKLADIEANVESGNAVLERAGYTPEQIEKMDDETWNRAILAQYRKEVPQITQPEYTEADLEGIEFQDEVFKVADENARLDDIYPEYTGETIEVDGKERTVYNSNGDRIANSKEALTNFWKWFGDSKVVDEQGRPLVVYHGTNAEFDTFDTKRIGKQDYGFYGKGFYFTDTKGVAEDYAKSSAFDEGEPVVMPVYLSLKNPFFVEYTNDNGISDEKHNRLKEQGYDGVIAVESRDLRKKGYEEELQKAKSLNVEHWQVKDFEGNIVGRVLPFEFVAWEQSQIKSVDNRGTFSEKTGNIYWQNRVSGGAPSTYRGAYIPEYRFILKANKMDASTLSHELAHDWFETNFARYRSGEATPEFMRAWGALEKALGIDENAKTAPRKASEAFARAYEGWIMNKSDWARLINVDDKDKDAIVKLMQDYQNNLRDIYQDLTNPYFKDTWGKLGELKPELVQWFDRATNITDLDTLVERGEMTEAEANQEKLNRAIDKVIENTADEETAETLKEVRTLNDTTRYEVEGGNKNALQERLSALAREIDENNMLSKGNNYDTRRDMMQVAEAADNFVKTRLNDALAIINGEMAEVEGLYKEDIYTALERLAVENGDLGLLDELKNSEIANRLAKELGQRVAGFRNWKQSTDLDVVSALKSLDNRFNKALENKKAQKEFNSALDLLDESLSQQDKIADKELEATLKALECQ